MVLSSSYYYLYPVGTNRFSFVSVSVFVNSRCVVGQIIDRSLPPTAQRYDRDFSVIVASSTPMRVAGSLLAFDYYVLSDVPDITFFYTYGKIIALLKLFTYNVVKILNNLTEKTCYTRQGVDVFFFF